MMSVISGVSLNLIDRNKNLLSFPDIIRGLQIEHKVGLYPFCYAKFLVDKLRHFGKRPSYRKPKVEFNRADRGI